MSGVVRLGLGLAAAQVTALAAMPFLTRLYSPHAFGAMGTFAAALTILAPVAALTYPTSIVIASTRGEALAIARLSLAIATAVAFLTMLVAMLPITATLLPEGFAREWMIFALPLALLLSACQQVSDYMLLRLHAFGKSASATFLQSLLSTLAKLCLGIVHPAAVSLVTVTALAPGLKALIQWGTTRESWIHESRSAALPLARVAKKHAQMPLYRAPQALINAASHNLPIILLGAYFGQATIGLFALAKLVMDAPSNLVAKSFGDVLYARLSTIEAGSRDFAGIISRGTRQLAVLGILPVAIAWGLGPWLFSFIFGQQWREAGELARWVAVTSYAFLVARPSVAAILVLNLQKPLLILEIASIPIRVLCFMAGYALFESAVAGIGGFAIASILFYTAIILIVHNKAYEQRDPG